MEMEANSPSGEEAGIESLPLFRWAAFRAGATGIGMAPPAR
jgi:hypothetical protein